MHLLKPKAMKKWIVVLRLGTLSIPEVISKTRFIVSSMTGNPYFAVPTPSLLAINAALHALENAADEAEGGGKEETALMHARRHELERLLTDEAHYVQRKANEDPEIGDVIIYSAGMEVKRSRGGSPRRLSAFNTETEGRVRVRTASEGRASYEWQYSTDLENWTDAGSTLQAATVIEGLTPGTRYYFRVRVLTKDGLSLWQDPVHLIVTG